MLARWDPWQDLLDLEREMRDLTRRLFGGTAFTPFERPSSQPWAPAVDVFSRDNDLVIRAELPGIDPEKDVEITVQDGMLTIKGERRQEEHVDREGYVRFESRYGAFQRTVPLPQGVKESDIRATYDRGVLEVVVPRAGEVASAKRIPVTAGGERKALVTRGRKKK
ncbi:MAG TPA: Hsp20/alpha crystallin family protein [Actinomycetota bacterium]|nr:Hsp20/alpha crystallin family protein [Actinomycetota bacterium]